MNKTRKYSWGTYASPSDIARDLGVQGRTVNQWIRKGLLGDYIVLPCGRGGNVELRVKTENYIEFLNQRSTSARRAL